MQVVLESARESYDASIIQEIQNNTLEDIGGTVSRVGDWYEAWKVNNS